VNVCDVDELFAPIVSLQPAWVAVTDLPPVTDGVVQPLEEMLTVPPDAGSDVGLTLIVQEAPPPVLGDVQLTVMLPEPSADAVNVELVHVSVAACTGIGATMNPPVATAAASTRLMLRWISMVYLEKRRRAAAIAPGLFSNPCANYRLPFMTLTSPSGGIRRTGVCRR